MDTTTTITTDRPRPQLRTVVRDALTRRRHARALKRDLQSYTTQAEIADLLATIEEHEGSEAQMMRGILVGNLRQAR
jgi:hypothetical protein